MKCERCDGTGDITIHERAVGINAGQGVPYGHWFAWRDTCPECGGSGETDDADGRFDGRFTQHHVEQSTRVSS